MTDTELAKRIAELPLEKRALLFQQLQKQREKEQAAEAETQRIPRQPRESETYPLSFAQQRLWFLNNFEPESPEYNVPQAFRIEGELDPEVMQRALREVVRRHETLRTTFRSVEGEPAQVIAQVVDMEVPYVDARARVSDPADAWSEALRLAAADAREPFDLTLGPLMRAKLFRAGEREYLLYYNVHHIAYDGWSMGVFARELAAIYDAFAAGLPVTLPELPVQYLDFALWQRRWLSGEILEAQLAYWRRRLASVPPLELPTDRPRPAVRTHNGTAIPLVLGERLQRELKGFAQREGSTLFIVLLAAFKALLHHWTTQEDISVGTLIANRRRPEVEAMIGFFANSLVLRTDLSGDPTFRELLARERETSLDAYAHQDVPFEKLVEELNPPRDMARTPLFQVMLMLLNTPGEAMDLPGLKLRPVAIESRTSKMELSVYLVDAPTGVEGFLEYNTDLFERATMERLLDHYQRVIGTVIEDPEVPLSELSLLSEEERRQVLVDWNATQAAFPPTTLHGWIEERVRQAPEAVAVEFEASRLTYRELDGRANRLARHLRGLGVGPETLVGIAMERSLEMLVGVLGVLKVGGGYVPIDPEYPKERLTHMLEDSRVPVLLTQESLLERLPEHGALVVAVDRDAAAIAAASAEPVDAGATPANIAYVIYTSGSTGKPKGVQIPHSAVVNFLSSMSRKPGLTSADTLLAVTTLSFDIAGLELYLPLVCGARLLLVSRETTQAGEKLREVLESKGVTAMQATPATWRLLLAAGWLGDRSLKILCGGEALPRDLASQLLGVCGSLWNVYGPTEATIWSTLDEVGAAGPITIGRPLDNTEIYLVSRQLKPVPVGVPGELLIGGAGLSRGYRGRPDLTAEKFIAHPFADLGGEPGVRLYRTGDLARHLADGRVEFLGRIDHQVKVRGFRIELGDIEAALDQHPAIAQAVVVAREDSPGSKQLAAYVVTAPGAEKPNVSDLRTHLKEKLPEYMVPAVFTFLEAMPLTPNGKVDRRALPAPDRASAAREYVAPRDDKEQFFCELWQELLNLERVGVNDDFFELGGDSLLVIRVVTKANKAAMGITTKQVFQHRTVADLAAVAGTIEILAEQGNLSGPLPWMPAQLQFLAQQHPNPGYHTLGMVFEPKDGALQVPLFERAMEHVVRHHDHLRVRLAGEGKDLHLVMDPPGAPVDMLRIDLSAIPEEMQLRAMGAAVRQVVISCKMEAGNLVRTVLFDDEPGKVRFLHITVHYMPADINSWPIFLDDLDAAYRQLEAGEPIAVPRKTTSARQWAERMAERAKPGGMPQQELDYWLAQAPLNPPRFPIDHDKGPNDWIMARVEPAELDVEETRILLQQVPRFLGVQIDAVLVTAVLAAFESWTGSRSLPVYMLGHGREALYDDMDLSRTVGWFNTIYPVLLDMGPGPDPIASARELNRQLRRIPHGGMGFGILRYLSSDPDVVDHMNRALAPQVFFNYFGPDSSKELGRLAKVQVFGGFHQDRRARRLCPLTVGIPIVEDRMQVKWEYNLNLHDAETIKPLAQRAAEVLRWFINDFRTRGTGAAS
ncbi:MAG TPA: amino acid adenylation domain-containing protein [Thermoanaerobaculia bacterium]|jgi:amino acid adenylation domain-containing protein/non-ribosomal peptide synthase protein (TIGR01720 family)